MGPDLFRSQTELVVLQVSVVDQRGRFVPGLDLDDFAVYEDGVRQSLRLFRHEDIPVTVGIVVDHSGSMRPKLADVIAAARQGDQSIAQVARSFGISESCLNRWLSDFKWEQLWLQPCARFGKRMARAMQCLTSSSRFR